MIRKVEKMPNLPMPFQMRDWSWGSIDLGLKKKRNSGNRNGDIEYL
ncbi:hypothetical protein PAAL109150_09005 [Paenibacillus alkaliterrae]